MKEIVISDELRDFFEKENEPLKELANEYNAMINNAKDKEIERLHSIIKEVREYIGLTDKDREYLGIYDVNGIEILNILDKVEENK